MWYDTIPTPAYVIDEETLIKNLSILKAIREETGCHILLASKAFSNYALFPLIAKYLDGATSSGYYEAKLAREEMNKEVHVFSPAYKAEEFDEIQALCDHMIFNSVNQWNTYKQRIKKGTSCGIRINPRYSEIEVAMYDPCRKDSRLGITKEELLKMDLKGIEGLHFHTMCEQGSETLQRTLEVVERDFKDVLYRMKWLNMGGGHHITKAGYNIELLKSLLLHMKETYDLEIYIEPGEAIAYEAGWLVAQVLDIHGKNVILDTSAACHMPDVLEMPYRPMVENSALPNEKACTYQFGGNTCLAGDIIGEYAFDEELHIGERILFRDMAIYTMVKNTTFNGVPLPAIYLYRKDHICECLKTFGYEDFKRRL